jgi:heat shock protein HslJ
MKLRFILDALLLASLCACAGGRGDPTVESSESAALTTLPGTTWRLVEFVSSDDRIGTVRPTDPTRYTLELQADGRAALRLDCNRGSATWTAAAAGSASGAFGFGPVAMTKVYCGPASIDQRIARDAEYVRTYLLRGDRLFLNLMADGGTYVWERTED